MPWSAPLFYLLPAAFAGGFVDAIVGGGGLILLPALLNAMPQTVPASVLGTNKGCSAVGLLSTASRYVRSVPIPWGAVLPGMLIGAAAASAGALAVSHLPVPLLRRFIPLVLAAMLIYTLAHRRLGTEQAPRNRHRRGWLTGAGLLALLGFYDGFLGPGAGALILFVLVRLYGLDFLRAAAVAKCLNLATNAGALLVFGLLDQVIWSTAAVLALASFAGAQLGTRLALARGAGFVRSAFVVLSSVLIARTLWEALR